MIYYVLVLAAGILIDVKDLHFTNNTSFRTRYILLLRSNKTGNFRICNKDA